MADPSDLNLWLCSNGADRPNRRQILRRFYAGAVAIGSSAAVLAEERATPEPSRPVPGSADSLPLISISRFEVSRLVAGSNPIGGHSHLTPNVSRDMREYFTVDRIVEYVQRCQARGINTWQTAPDRQVFEALDRLRKQGNPVQWICLYADRPEAPPLKDLLARQPIAIVHHGGVTDAIFRQNQHQKVLDFVKRIHDSGVLAGVSSHDPENIAYMEDKGWENTFYMTCLYNLTQQPEEVRRRFGTVPVGEIFLEADRLEMSRVIMKVGKPCLAFKVLAAGRLTQSPQDVERAFREAFGQIKRSDGIVVGMYPKHTDEVADNVRLTLKYAAAGSSHGG